MEKKWGSSAPKLAVIKGGGGGGGRKLTEERRKASPDEQEIQGWNQPDGTAWMPSSRLRQKAYTDRILEGEQGREKRPSIGIKVGINDV